MLRYALALTGALALSTGITGITGFAAPAMAADAAPKIDNNHLYNGGRPCDTAKPYHLVGAEAEYLQALGIDRNNGLDRLQFRFVVWPLSNQEAKTEIMKWDDGPGRVATAQIPQGVLRDGETYGWRVQVSKGEQTSGWSQRCFFKVDLARPASPTIDVPEMYEGVPAKLRISGNGDPEIVGYEYTLGWNDIPVSGCLWSGELGQLVCGQPNPPLKGESATLDLTLPGGPHILKVRAVDRVGNRSEVASQNIYVNYTSPTIEQVGFAEYGSEVTLKFTPHPALTNVVAHVYTINGGQEQTVAAGPDGTATVTVPLNQESVQVVVRTKRTSDSRSLCVMWI